jgi:AcrR family transcriptional regulator
MPSTKSRSSQSSVELNRSPRRRLPAPERRELIIRGAFEVLATVGFEGLRMREVAAAVGLNSATLHHYFPTKEDLVRAVAEHLGERFTAVHAPELPNKRGVSPPLRQLRQEFSDAAYCRKHYPDLLAASRELAMRGSRDPLVAEAIAPLNNHWRESVAVAVRNGQREGVFRDSLDADSIAAAFVAAIWGMTALLQLSAQEFAAGCAALEQALLL